MNKYFKSKSHIYNAKEASKLGSKKLKQLKLLRVQEYDLNPKLCLQCKTAINYEKKTNSFCSSSCACTYNNSKRTANGWKPSEEQKMKVSKALKGRPSPLKGVTHSEKYKRTKDPKYLEKNKKFEITCKICKKVKSVGYRQKNNKTCGDRKCRTEASVGIRIYQNGSRKTTWYYNKNENKKVLLESSWEVSFAEFLDINGVHWIRPKPLEWFDATTNKNRLYFPDFYLKGYDVYFDPKNPYAMEKDKYKMEQVCKKVNVKYGDIEVMKAELLQLIS